MKRSAETVTINEIERDRERVRQLVFTKQDSVELAFMIRKAIKHTVLSFALIEC